jgi:hypothetical protein
MNAISLARLKAVILVGELQNLSLDKHRNLCNDYDDIFGVDQIK